MSHNDAPRWVHPDINTIIDLILKKPELWLTTLTLRGDHIIKEYTAFNFQGHFSAVVSVQYVFSFVLVRIYPKMTIIFLPLPAVWSEEVQYFGKMLLQLLPTICTHKIRVALISTWNTLSLVFSGPTMICELKENFRFSSHISVISKIDSCRDQTNRRMKETKSVWTVLIREQEQLWYTWFVDEKIFLKSL